MATTFQPGDQVFWWKGRYPFLATVVAVTDKRITIDVEDPKDAKTRFIRHVTPEKIQPVAAYFVKAANQGPAIREPAASWGRFTRYLEIGEDLQALRLVDVFENGNSLSYDRVHWIDEFGMLGSARMNRNVKQGLWGQSVEIEGAEFEQVWNTARASTIWPQQVEKAWMSSWGTNPLFLTDWRHRPGQS